MWVAIIALINAKRSGPASAADMNSAAQLNVGQKLVGAGLMLEGPNCVKANPVDCLGACDSGPIHCVRPDGCWYHHVAPARLDRIVAGHLLLSSAVADCLLHKDPTGCGCLTWRSVSSGQAALRLHAIPPSLGVFSLQRNPAGLRSGIVRRETSTCPFNTDRCASVGGANEFIDCFGEHFGAPVLCGV